MFADWIGNAVAGYTHLLHISCNAQGSGIVERMYLFTGVVFPQTYLPFQTPKAPKVNRGSVEIQNGRVGMSKTKLEKIRSQGPLHFFVLPFASPFGQIHLQRSAFVSYALTQ